MSEQPTYDAIIVGSGPNGLAAAITMAQAGRSTLVLEAAETVGGGIRSAELTLPGFVHDVSAAVCPLAAASPFFRSLKLEEHGLQWIHPPTPLAHPFDDGTAASLEYSVQATAETLGRDAAAYRRAIEPLVANWDKLVVDVLGPLRLPHHPLALARFGLGAIQSAQGFASRAFKTDRARAFFAGMAVHSIMPLDRPMTASFGLILCMAGHTVGWPIARGGSQRISDALASYLRSLGGKIVTGVRVESVEQLPPARAVLFDVTPRQLLKIAGHRLPFGYRRKLGHYRYGPGVFKIDWALDGPIPWRAVECARAGTVHIGGSLDEIAESERAVWRGDHPQTPFVIVAQQSLFDPTRAPDGKHTAWGYCHVPDGSSSDMTERIENQIERFAPGFRDRVLPVVSCGLPDLKSIMPTTSAAASLAVYTTCASYLGGPFFGWCRTLPPPEASTSARHLHLQVEVCTACAAIWPRKQRYETPEHKAARTLYEERLDYESVWIWWRQWRVSLHLWPSGSWMT